jgi:hypothetical protein
MFQLFSHSYGMAVERIQISVLCLCVAFTTHGQSVDDLVKQWGEATNGLRLGLNVHLKDSWGREQTPKCIVYGQNITSNRMSWRLAPETPKNIRLFHRSGLEATIRQSTLVTINRTRIPITHGAGGIVQLKSFSLTNLFDLKTNGIYTLVVSESATTNVIHGRRSPVYFALPPVTNTFELTMFRDE